MNRSGWLVFGAVVVAVVLCGCLILAVLVPGWFVTGGRPYGPGMGHMFGDCPWCGGGGGLGSIGAAELLVLALVFAVLAALAAGVVLVVVWLIRSSRSSQQEEIGKEE
jgi:hypothetical protein